MADNLTPGERWRNWRNRLDWTWGRRFAYEWRSFRENAGDKSRLLADKPEARAREDALRARYDLNRLYQEADALRYLETLAYLDWLEVFAAEAPALGRQPAQSNLRWLDVGAKNWAYVGALHAFLIHQRGEAPFRLDGIELDVHRRYVDGTTRGQAARHYCRHLPHTAYHGGDVLKWAETAHVISHFLPFVFREPHLAWGLPIDYFEPAAVLRHTVDLLEPGGFLLIVNQGDAEAREQARLLASVAHDGRIAYKEMGRLPDHFIGYRHPRYGWLCEKPA